MMDFFRNFYYGKEEGVIHERSKSMTEVEKSGSMRRINSKVTKLVGEKDPSFPYPNKTQLENENGIYDNVILKLVEREGEFNKKKLLLHVIKQLGAGADLFRIGVPPSLLSPLSMLEYIARIFKPTKELTVIDEISSPLGRLKTLVSWCIRNFARIPAKGICHAKPLNPIIGEIFRCKYIVDGKEVFAFMEQISHHPPETAFWIMDEQKKFTFTGSMLPKSKLGPNSASTLFNGVINFTLHKLDEVYEVTLPSIVAYGTLWGSQYIEINDSLKIKCKKTGLKAVINYKSKSKNKMTGYFKKGKKKIFNIEGICGEEVLEVDLKNPKKKVAIVSGQDLFDFKKSQMIFLDIKKNDLNESRRIWHRVIRNLLTRNFVQANKCKHAVEEIQREKRKKRKKEKTKHEIKFFKRKDKKGVEFIYDRRVEDNDSLFNF